MSLCYPWDTRYFTPTAVISQGVWRRDALLWRLVLCLMYIGMLVMLSRQISTNKPNASWDNDVKKRNYFLSPTPSIFLQNESSIECNDTRLKYRPWGFRIFPLLSNKFWSDATIETTCDEIAFAWSGNWALIFLNEDWLLCCTWSCCACSCSWCRCGSCELL